MERVGKYIFERRIPNVRFWIIYIFIYIIYIYFVFFFGGGGCFRVF